MRRPFVWLLALALLFGTSACSDSDDAEGAGDGDGGWTVLSYSIADTNLEPYMMNDVAEMGAVGSGDNLDIVALVDRAADYSADPVLGIPDWTGAKLLDINKDSAKVVKEMGDLNTGDPKVLTAFIADAIKAKPAEHYALIISDHGASWPGVGGDESSDGDGLDLNEIHGAVAAGLEKAGVDKLDLLGFDACLMATYEVASTMAPLADRMVASQELEPGHGWDYNALQVLADDPATTADAFGRALVKGFKGQAKAEETDAEITLAMIDLTKMEGVDEAVAAFGGALSERAATVSPVVGRERAKVLGFGRSPDPEEDTQMTDLGGLASAIGTEALDVSDEADALVKAINDAVIVKVDGAATRGASGLSIYFPTEAGLLREDYANVESAEAWASFLASYYQAGEEIPEAEQPVFANGDNAAETFFDEDGVNIVGTFNGTALENLTEAIISYGVVEADGTVTYIGEEPAEIADDGSNRAIGVYDLTQLTISDGEDTAEAYLQLTLDSDEEGEGDVATIDVPMAYYAEGDQNGETYQDVLLSLVLDPESGDILSETYYAYDEETETYGELTADAEGIIVPEVVSYDAEGNEEWKPTTDVGLFANLDDLEYDLTPLAKGTKLQVELTVYDFGDNSDTVSAQVAVP